MPHVDGGEHRVLDRRAKANAAPVRDDRVAPQTTSMVGLRLRRSEPTGADQKRSRATASREAFPPKSKSVGPPFAVASSDGIRTPTSLSSSGIWISKTMGRCGNSNSSLSSERGRKEKPSLREIDPRYDDGVESRQGQKVVDNPYGLDPRTRRALPPSIIWGGWEQSALDALTGVPTREPILQSCSERGEAPHPPPDRGSNL